MLSNHVINQQKFVLFVDHYGMERHSEDIFRHLLKQQTQDPVLVFPQSLPYSIEPILCDMSLEHLDVQTKTNFINKLKRGTNVKQIFLWATTKNISEDFVVPFLEYLAELIVTLDDSKHLTIVTRKSGGGVTNKYYQYQLGNGDFIVKELKRVAQKPEEATTKPEASFKIDLEEEEMVARNALKLPYERTNDKEGQILYTPDADDDFDEEDPDDDLCI